MKQTSTDRVLTTFKAAVDARPGIDVGGVTVSPGYAPDHLLNEAKTFDL